MISWELYSWEWWHNWVPFGQTVKNHFTHTLSVQAMWLLWTCALYMWHGCCILTFWLSIVLWNCFLWWYHRVLQYLKQDYLRLYQCLHACKMVFDSIPKMVFDSIPKKHCHFSIEHPFLLKKLPHPLKISQLVNIFNQVHYTARLVRKIAFLLKILFGTTLKVPSLLV